MHHSSASERDTVERRVYFLKIPSERGTNMVAVGEGGWGEKNRETSFIPRVRLSQSVLSGSNITH